MDASDIEKIAERAFKEEMLRLSQDQEWINKQIHQARWEKTKQEAEEERKQEEWRRARKLFHEQMMAAEQIRRKNADKPWKPGKKVHVGFQGEVSERFKLHCQIPDDDECWIADAWSGWANNGWVSRMFYNQKRGFYNARD